MSLKQFLLNSRFIAVSLSIFLFAGCAVYKQLQPFPLPSSVEQGYQELKIKEKDFELKQGKKYFISFPAPSEKHFYLIVEVPSVKSLRPAFTSDLVKKSKPGILIANEAQKPDNMCVYAVHSGTPEYFLLLDTVPADVSLRLKYRYVPQWRFKFENHHTAFKAAYKDNKVSRTEYQNLGYSFHFSSDYNFAKIIQAVEKSYSEIKKVHAELLAIESIFPKSILNSADPAYRDYVALKKEVEEEKQFQADWLEVLYFAKKEMESRTGVSAFLSYLKDFIAFCNQKSRFPANITTESRTLMNGRLNTVIPYYNDLLATKSDILPYDSKLCELEALPYVDSLNSAVGRESSAEYHTLVQFVNDFNARCVIIPSVLKELSEMPARETAIASLPENGAYQTLAAAAEEIKKKLPAQIGEGYGLYGKFKSSVAYNAEVSKAATLCEMYRGQFVDAEALVTQLNQFKSREGYAEMISLLAKNRKY
ncbi:MAG: hypothetical protein JNL74_22850, partial [Fibrobacteres bacterium]|nr:hypothetical protein [Fibrobacterota bacterium]